MMSFAWMFVSIVDITTLIGLMRALLPQQLPEVLQQACSTLWLPADPGGVLRYRV
jgi:hypothetical protein